MYLHANSPERALVALLQCLATDRGEPQFIFFQRADTAPDGQANRVEQVVNLISDIDWWQRFVTFLEDGRLRLDRELDVNGMIKPVAFHWYKHPSGQVIAICLQEFALTQSTRRIDWPPMVSEYRPTAA